MDEPALDDVTRALARTWSQEAPATLAETLARSPAALVRTFFAALDDDILARLATHCSPWWLVHVLDQESMIRLARAAMSAESAAAAVRWLRLASDDVQSAVLDGLSDGGAKLRNLLTIPPHCVGAWAEARVPVAVDNQSIGSALEALAAQRPRYADRLWVIEHDGQFVGEVPLWRALGADPDTLLAAIVDRRRGTLLDTMGLEAAEQQVNWEQRPVWPVVRRSGDLVGAISLVEVHRGLGLSPRTGDRGVLAAIVGVWLDVLTALFAGRRGGA
jgi:Mg/Co/Ni transporter MgtE